MNELVDKIKATNSSEAYSELRTKVENTYYSLYHKQVKKSNATLFEKDNFLESLDQLLIECVYSYDPEKGMSFNTYFFSMARFKALNVLCKHKSVRAETVDMSILNGDSRSQNDVTACLENTIDNNHDSEKELELFSFMDRIRSSGILNSEINSFIFDFKLKGEKNATIIKELQGKFKFSQETAYKKVKQLNNTIKKYYNE